MIRIAGVPLPLSKPPAVGGQAAKKIAMVKEIVCMKHDEAFALFDYACSALGKRSKCFEGELTDGGAHFMNHYADIQFNVSSDRFGYFLIGLCVACGKCIECNCEIKGIRGVDAFLDRNLKSFFKMIHGTYQMSLMEALQNV